VLIALIGGAATLWGPLLAAVVFSLLAETLRLQLPQVYMMSLGLLLILSVLYLPGGLALDPLAGARHERPSAARGRALTVRFGGLTAVDAVSAAFAPGELVGIIGPNGAGKTTFFNAFSGVLAPTSASCSPRRAAHRRAPHRFAERGIARTFQTPRVFAALSVGRQRRLRPQLRRPAPPGAGLLRDAASILALLGLDRERRKSAGGDHAVAAALLEIGMALATRPRVLLARRGRRRPGGKRDRGDGAAGASPARRARPDRGSGSSMRSPRL
jgi:ABC-type uncharacterized transport system YnjBCD ATPase subunit